jgi:O-antigen/teichoic acid export membrane protein
MTKRRINTSQQGDEKYHEFFETSDLKNDLKSKTIRGAGVTIFAQLVYYGIQIIGAIILARLLTPDDFGLVMMVAAFSVLFQNFSVIGFTEVIVQREGIHHKQISTLFWINIGLCLLLATIFATLSPVFAWFYKDQRLSTIVIVMSLSIIFAGFSTHHQALLIRKMRFAEKAANDVFAVLFSVIIGILLATIGWGYWALVIRRISIPFTTAIGVWVLCRWRPGLPAFAKDVIPLLKFIFNYYGSFISSYIHRNLDKILIGRFHGSQALGFYERACQLSSMLPNQLYAPLSDVAIATLSRLQNDPEKYRNYYSNILSMLAFISMPASAALTLVGTDLIIFLLGSTWSKAGEVFSALGPGIGMSILYGTYSWLHISLGRADRLFRWSTFALIITIIAFLIGLPFGVLGVAVAYSASYYILICPALWYAGRPIGLRLSFFVSATWKSIISALIAGLLCWHIIYNYEITSNLFIQINIILRILLSILSCISIYLLLIIIFYRSTEPIFRFLSILYELLPDNKFKHRIFSFIQKFRWQYKGGENR